MDRNKKGLMQVDPMTGMPVAQPGSTPMFPVSEGAMGGSASKFNPAIDQYAQADPLANAAYASSPMNALAQKKGQVKIGTLEKVIEPKSPVQDTATYKQMATGRRLEKLLSDPEMIKAMKVGQKVGQKVGEALPQDKPIPKDATGLQELAKSGPKGEAAVENMGYNPNALARMRGNGMYKKNCGYKK